jgi:GT2 family glycosyltransferase
MSKVRVQSVLFKNSTRELENLLLSLIEPPENQLSISSIYLGVNCATSSMRTDYERLIKIFKKKYCVNIEIMYSKKNIGHGAMHNSLIKSYPSKEDFLLIVNPDGQLNRDSIKTMIYHFGEESVGIVEARQIPLEHPKFFEVSDFSTAWTSGACMMIRLELYKKVDGFDERFFLHCDDVDLSWRVRELDYKLVYSPFATFYHRKNLGQNGYPIPSLSENFYGPLGALLLAHKYKMHKPLRLMIKDLKKSQQSIHIQVLEEFSRVTKYLSQVPHSFPIPEYHHPWRFTKHRF